MSPVLVRGNLFARRRSKGVRALCAETNKGVEVSARKCGEGVADPLRGGVKGGAGSFDVGWAE